MAKIGSKRASAWMSSGAPGASKAGLGKWRGRSGRNAWRVRKIRSKMEANSHVSCYDSVTRLVRCIFRSLVGVAATASALALAVVVAPAAASIAGIFCRGCLFSIHNKYDPFD